MRADELDYVLPDALIAQEPLERRDGARMLVLPPSGPAVHRTVRDLPDALPPSLFVFNDTRVIPARLIGQRPSGGRYELLLVEQLGHDVQTQSWLAMGRPLKSLKPGLVLEQPGLAIVVGERVDANLVHVTLQAPGGVREALERVGHVPLPPYIARADEPRDRERYQTVFAREPGAVAAPTASLHFSEELLASLAARGHERAFVTLHVGPGTFAPLSVDDLRDHPMHEERYDIPAETVVAIARAKREGRPVIAVGTTVVRTLEAAADQHGQLREGPGRTRIFIYPPYAFRVIDGLLTNFHLPRSTLLALVMAVAGGERTRQAYGAAVEERYRFFSYGDAMLISPQARPGRAEQ